MDDERTSNLLGALALSVMDAFNTVVAASAGSGGETPAALVTLGADPGVSINQLRQILNLSHPGTVRLIDRLEKEGHLLVLRHKKDNAPRFIWPDSPNYHVGQTKDDTMPGKVDDDFQDYWRKTKLPANDVANAGLADKVIPLDQIGGEIMRRVKENRAKTGD